MIYLKIVQFFLVLFLIDLYFYFLLFVGEVLLFFSSSSSSFFWDEFLNHHQYILDVFHHQNQYICYLKKEKQKKKTKRLNFLNKVGVKRENRHIPKMFWKTDSGKFCLTYFSKLNRNIIEKNLYCFERPLCNR